MPIGLMLIEQGCITHERLREALDQRARAILKTGGPIRLGEWLIRNGTLPETVISRALGAQWGCPVFALDHCPPAAGSLSVLPLFLAESLAALPMVVGSGRAVYLGFAGRPDRSLSYAVERMVGLPVTAGIVSDSQFRVAHTRFLNEPAPRVRFVEARSSDALAQSLTKLIEREQPLDAQLARVHDVCWLRIWKSDRRPAGLPDFRDVEDILCTVGQNFTDPS